MRGRPSCEAVRHAGTPQAIMWVRYTANETGNRVEYLLMKMEFPKDQKFLDNPNVWKGDTGGSVHMTPHRSGMHDIKTAHNADAISMANGKSENAAVIGSIDGRLCDKNGNVLNDAKISDVAHLPKAKYNLFSITKLQNDGWALGGNADAIWLTKGDVEIVFDIKIPTPKGNLYAMYNPRKTEVAAPTTNAATAGAAATIAAVIPAPKRMSGKKAHAILGHINEKAVRKTVIALGWELTRGTLGVCEPCTEAKAKQKYLPRHPDAPPSTKDEKRIYLDIATIKETKNGLKVYKGNWRIMVDERTQLNISDFFDTKNGMVEGTCEQLHRWKQSGKGVEIIRLDNAGENKLLQQRSQSADWKLGAKFEFTARDTPQQNHLAELGFAHLANYGRPLMARANVPMKIRYKVFTKAFKTATSLDGLTVIQIGNKEATRYEHWCGKNPDFSEYLRTWGEVGTVKTKLNATPRIGDRGIQCMFVGYLLDHTADCYEMWDPATSRVHQTRDVIWLNWMCYNRSEPTNNIVVEPDMEPVIVYRTDNLAINNPGRVIINQISMMIMGSIT
jgi:hypothetical protein